jgi:hypothetical protein
MGIESLDERGLKAMIANYEQKNVAEGGKYTLAECLLAGVSDSARRSR